MTAEQQCIYFLLTFQTSSYSLESKFLLLGNFVRSAMHFEMKMVVKNDISDVLPVHGMQYWDPINFLFDI